MSPIPCPPAKERVLIPQTRRRILPEPGDEVIRLTPQQQVDRYEVEGLIGIGGLAEVYRVRHLELGKRCALKVLREPSESIYLRTLREGRLQASIEHPNVLAIYDVLRLDGAPALVMEYVEGPTLEQLLRHYQPGLVQLDGLMRGILAGVMAAHDKGLIHRDLKPANVLIAVERDGLVPKVADFGLARAAVSTGDHVSDPRLTRQGAMLGTPAYMSPEQFADAYSVDGRADIFALGAIMYELVTGVMAIPGRDAMECYRTSVAAAWRPVRELVPSLPTRMVRAVEAALEPDAGLRVKSVEALLSIWTGEEAGRRVSLPGEAWWEPEQLELVRALAPVLQTEDGAEAGQMGAYSPTPSLPRDDAPARPPVTLARPSAPTPAPLPVPRADALADDPLSTLEERELVAAAAGFRTPWARVAAGVALVALVVVVAFVALRGPAPVEPEVAAPQPVGAPEAPAPSEDAAAEPAPVEETPAPAPARVAAKAAAAVIAPEAAPAEEPAAPAPSPVAAAAPSNASSVVISGVSRAYLIDEAGKRYEPGAVPPGQYALYVFFDESAPTRALDVEVSATAARYVRCEAGLRVCR